MSEAMFSEIVLEILKDDSEFIDLKKLNNIKISLAKKYKYKRIIKNPEIISYANENERKNLIRKLNIKPVRELSGVTVVALFAKPHSCPHGKCIYCPGGIGSPFGDTPQSYTGKEPAAMRAIRNNYDPYLQVFNRLEHYVVNGHLPDKLELIFMGGTFPSLDREYRDEFVRLTYKAVNDFGELFIKILDDGSKSIDYEKFFEFFESRELMGDKMRDERIEKRVLDFKKRDILELDLEIKRNERAKVRCIGLTIETKPDWGLYEHCKEMLRYGCTRFEVGVQTLDDKCLKKTMRGHGILETIECFQVMKDMCFKINAHMMLGLPASNLESDERSLEEIFTKKEFRPDMIKIYPCLVVAGTPLYKMWEMGLFKPIDTEVAARIIARKYVNFPRYVRVMRVQRDIPTTVVLEGIRNSNLRQIVDLEVEKLDIEPKEIRSREIGFRIGRGFELGNFSLRIEEFEASSGREFFIDVCDENDTMIGFIRMRFPSRFDFMPEITEKTALIRELHVYGNTIPVGSQNNSEQQHKGWGGKLLLKAEEIARERGYEKMAIISGVGVREYYEKKGYLLEGPYMTKFIWK